MFENTWHAVSFVLITTTAAVALFWVLFMQPKNEVMFKITMPVEVAEIIMLCYPNYDTGHVEEDIKNVTIAYFTAMAKQSVMGKCSKEEESNAIQK